MFHEHVEEDDGAGAATFLRHYACDQMQGYLFAKPLPADEIVPFLQQALRPRTLEIPRPTM